jgi:uncharacterized membrane protein
MHALTPAILVHLATAIPAALLGAVILSRRKGTTVHKMLGRVWVVLMLVTAVGSFGIQTSGRLSWIHILSVVTIVSIVAALISIRRGNREAHRRSMQGAYGGLMIAFAFTLLPGRLMGQWLRQLVEWM